jgi:hypothetical protein
LILVFCHCLADYPLQGDFLSKAKNRLNPIPGVPWYQAMAAHAAIHAGFVGIVTGSVVLGMLEFCVHFIIDDTKCAGIINYNTDQAAHVVCKIAWVCLLVLYYLNAGAMFK